MYSTDSTDEEEVFARYVAKCENLGKQDVRSASRELIHASSTCKWL